MDPSADQHQHGQLSNRKSKKGRKDEEGNSRKTEGEENSEGKKEAPERKKYNLYLTSLTISREVLIRIVVFLIVYLILTRLVKIFTPE